MQTQNIRWFKLIASRSENSFLTITSRILSWITNKWEKTYIMHTAPLTETFSLVDKAVTLTKDLGTYIISSATQQMFWNQLYNLGAIHEFALLNKKIHSLH